MKIAVKDANILIDLELMGLIDLWLQLPFQTMTTSFVVQELRKGGHQQALGYIRTEAIREVPLDLFDLAGEIELHRGSGLSDSDVSVLFLAQQESALLLSGDGLLRETAYIQKIEVHGTIWILDQLVAADVLVKNIAAEKLSYLVSLEGEKKRYLPKGICSKRIEKWRA
jgi:predicted nucleic acid-binding protein